jgi:ATP-binding cassette, subfamily B, multidrug efflux pump
MSNKPSDDRDRSKFARPGGGHGGPWGNRRIEKAKDPKRTLIRLLPYRAQYRMLLALVFIFVLFYTLLGLLSPYLLGLAIDQFIGGKDPGGLARISLLMLVVYLVNNFFQGVASWTMSIVSQGALKSVRKHLFDHMQTLSLRFFDQTTAGELMSRLTNDIDAINQAISQNVVSLFASVLSMIGILVAMFVLNAWLALAALVVVPIMLLFTEFVARYTRKGFRELQKQLGQLNSVMEESISGQRVVKAFGRTESVTANFRQANQDVFKAGVFANTYAFMLMPLTNVLGNFFVIVLAGFGGYLGLKGLVTVGMLATFIAYGQSFLNPVRQIATIYNTIQAALAGAERVFGIIDTEPELIETEDAIHINDIRGDVQFNDVIFGYSKDVPVIKGMSLEAKAGETVALVGPTGAGKTTIINLLTRFYDVDEGSICVDGVDIRQTNKEDLRRELGLVLQDTFLFSGTVMDNIRYGRLDASDEECIEAAKMADADHFIRLLPQGYQTELSERAGNLSQGQRQMLSISRAVLADPGILILDEATSSVDTRTEAHIQSALLRLMKGRTSFVIAHRLSTIREADKVVVINNGEIVEKGTHQELLDLKGFFYQLYISQFKGQAI